MRYVHSSDVTCPTAGNRAGPVEMRRVAAMAAASARRYCSFPPGHCRDRLYVCGFLDQLPVQDVHLRKILADHILNEQGNIRGRGQEENRRSVAFYKPLVHAPEDLS